MDFPRLFFLCVVMARTNFWKFWNRWSVKSSIKKKKRLFLFFVVIPPAPCAAHDAKILISSLTVLHGHRVNAVSPLQQPFVNYAKSSCIVLYGGVESIEIWIIKFSVSFRERQPCVCLGRCLMRRQSAPRQREVILFGCGEERERASLLGLRKRFASRLRTYEKRNRKKG